MLNENQFQEASFYEISLKKLERDQGWESKLGAEDNLVTRKVVMVFSKTPSGFSVIIAKSDETHRSCLPFSS